MTTKRYLAALLAAAVIGGGYFAYQAVTGVEHAPSVDYVLLDGARHNTGDLRGKVVLVNFWATTCASCLQEMPQIAELHRRFASRGYETLSVSMSYDAPASVIGYAQRRALPFSVAIDNTGAIARGFGAVEVTPTSLLIDPQGRIVKRFVGTPDFAALQALVEKLLPQA